MGDRLTFPLPRVPAVLPHPEDLLVTLTKDETLQSFPITTPLTPETIPNSEDAHAALHAVQRLRHTFSSPFGTPDSILDCPTWLRMILENLAGIHKGFRNAQLISPDADLPKSFRSLDPEELNTVARIFEITSWLQDFCEAAEEDHDDNHVAPYCTICIRCVESADLPPAPANITDIMLTNALEVRALRETLRNQAIRTAVKNIEEWRETQTEAMITDLVNFMTNPDTDISSLARTAGGLDPRITAWVDSIRGPIRKAAIEMVTQETVEDCIIPHAQEFLEGAWMRRQTEIEHEIRKRSSEHETELRRSAEEYASKIEQELRASTDNTIAKLKAQLNDKLANEIEQLKNQAKVTLQAAKAESDSHALTLAIRTLKPPKPSPLNLMKPKKKKGKKKATNVLDLTTPPPDAPSEMETDTDSTPTMPICRSSAPSPSPAIDTIDLTSITPTPPPMPVAPESVPTDIANPETIPRWAQTPSPDDRTPHAPSFQINPLTHTHAPNPVPTPVTNPGPQTNPELAAILSALTGLRSELIDRIEKVNARVDLTTGPETIADHVLWNNENMAAWEHPGYVDPQMDADMEMLADANAKRKEDRLLSQRAFRTLHHRFAAEKKIRDLDPQNDEVYLKKWYQVCTDLTKSMNWDLLSIPAEADDTILNAWHCAECALNEEEYTYSTHAIFERITGTKPNTSSPEGRAQFNTFTTAYNDFCATQNFPAWEGFPSSTDEFFKFFLTHAPKAPVPTGPTTPKTTTPTTKSVRFASAPPIATLPPPSSSPEEFPALQAPTKAPISYASATSSFIPVTRRCHGKQPTTPTATTTTPPTPTTKPTTKPSKPTKPPLPDALKTTKHTIILDHTLSDTKALYSLNAGELTLGLQRHLEAVKAPLVLLAGAWSTAPFYKNFILTFSGVVPFTDITKYNSILFGPFSPNCRAAPTAGYQSILISGVRLQRDINGKLASPKMLFDELCRNPVFVGHLPLATPRWLFNPEKLLSSDKQASSITFSFHDPTGEGLELMKRSRVGMFGKLVTIRSWEARPLLSQYTRCLCLGHTVDRCRRHKDLVVCSKCGGAHQDALHHFNCPRSDRHKGRGCDCPPSCFLCIAQGNNKVAQGHTSTSVTCLIRKHFRLPSDTPTINTNPGPSRDKSTTIPPTLATDAPMHVLTSSDIRHLSAEGLSTEAITRLLVPQEVADMASTSAPMSS